MIHVIQGDMVQHSTTGTIQYDMIRYNTILLSIWGNLHWTQALTHLAAHTVKKKSINRQKQPTSRYRKSTYKYGFFFNEM